MESDPALGSVGFTDGELYDSARPDYPEVALDYFVDKLSLDSSTSAIDLGAGTGIFSRQIAPRVGSLIAIEPSASMRATFRRNLPHVPLASGSDVSIPLPTGSTDVVFVAQAFHWFTLPDALHEIARVLKSDGHLALIWNERDESVEWVHDVSQAMRWDAMQPYPVGKDFTAELASGPFVDIERRMFRHVQTLDHDSLLRRVSSTSYIVAMETAERDRLMESVREVVDQLPTRIELPYMTDTYVASVSAV